MREIWKLTMAESQAQSDLPKTPRNLIIMLRTRIPAVFVGLVLAISSVALFPLSTVHAETLNYPWSEAACKFGSNGGSDCHNTAEGMAWDKYNWGVYSNGVFQPYRNGYQYRNCTDYAQWRIATLGGTVQAGLGNGGNWYSNSASSKQSSTPHAGYAAVKPPSQTDSFGHVAVVESVNTDGTITISEYNGLGTGAGRTRTGVASSMGFTQFVDFGATVSSGTTNTAPTAGFTVPVNDQDLLVTLDGTNSWDSDGTIASYFWEFGDGQSQYGAKVKHQYYTTGVYAVKLTVTDNGSATTSLTQSINVRAAQMTGDVTGDGKADVVVFINGGWYVAPSNGSSFTRNTANWNWVNGFGTATNSRPMLADVNGDGKADAVIYYPSSGDWYVALSNGTSFIPNTNTWRWLDGFGASPMQPMLADVTGDGKADAIQVNPQNGYWYVAPSSGSNFTKNPSTWQWAANFGTGSYRQMIADVTGDGKADAVIYGQGDLWYVAPSTGTGFTVNPANWQWNTSNFGQDSLRQMLTDVTGDSKADAVVYVNGYWYVAPSTGTTFTLNSLTWRWASSFGATPSRQLVDDVTGDGKSDALVFYATVGGNWYGAASTGSTFNVSPSTWLWLNDFGSGT